MRATRWKLRGEGYLQAEWLQGREDEAREGWETRSHRYCVLFRLSESDRSPGAGLFAWRCGLDAMFQDPECLRVCQVRAPLSHYAWEV